MHDWVMMSMNDKTQRHDVSLACIDRHQPSAIVSCQMFSDHYSAPIVVPSIVINPSACASVCLCVSVCVCLSASISLEPLERSARNFVRRSGVAVARSSSGGVGLRYVLPVLWMASCLAVMGRMELRGLPDLLARAVSYGGV